MTGGFIDSFEFTKRAGAVLSALLLIFGARTLIDMTVGHTPEKPGYVLPTTAPAEPAASSESPAAAPADDGEKEVIALLSKANAENGKAIFKKCQACHVSEKGKTPTVGPNLWDVVNRKKGHLSGIQVFRGDGEKGRRLDL